MTMSEQIEIQGDCQFPTEWTLFGPVERGGADPDLYSMTEVPAVLAMAGKEWPGQEVSLRSERGCWKVDLGALLGGVSEGKTAYLLTSLTVEQEMEVTFGASADWWMRWWLNGQTIYDTLAEGNRSPHHTTLAHWLVARLKTGRNLLAVKVVSGSMGYCLAAGGPRELRELQRQMQAVGNYPLWSGAPLSRTAELPMLDGVEFSVIKPPSREWQLGVALGWHCDKLYASYGFNTGAENTVGEEARGRVSADGGKTWGDEFVIAASDDKLGISHGVFLEHQGSLWSFNGAFNAGYQRTHTRAYRLDDASGRWQPMGVAVGDGFWPMQEPLRMADGNWIMSGVRLVDTFGMDGNWPAVAISRGGDLTKWDLVVIRPRPGLGEVWGESTVFIHGNRIFNISRWGRENRALIASSDDGGRTWTEAERSNLNMNTSKPYTGTLSTGQHYLIAGCAADCVHQRDLLTVAVTCPGETRFSRVFALRRRPNACLSYPYAVERDGKLYVGYSDKSDSSAELAVIPLERLATT